MVVHEAAQILSDDSVSDKEAMKTINQLMKSGSSKQLTGTQLELQNEPEVINGCARLLVRQNSKLQSQACKALGTLSFGSDGVAAQITRAPGMLDNLATLMINDGKESQLEAARVICNCASYSNEAAEEIVQNPAIISALQKLCRSKDSQVKSKAVGAISCLSACPLAVEILQNTSIVEDSLMPCILAKKSIFGSKDVFEITRLDALTAVVNLDKSVDLSQATAKDSLKTLKMCLMHSLKGKTWAGVTWSPYNTLVPLAKLSSKEDIRPIFGDLKFVKVLVSALEKCQTPSEKSLALQCLANLSVNKDCLKSIRKGKYCVLQLCERQLSCNHSTELAQWLIETLKREEIEEELSNDNDNTESKDDMTESKKDDVDDSSNDGEGEEEGETVTDDAGLARSGSS